MSGLQEGHWGLSLLAIDAAGAVNEAAEQSFWVALTAPTAPVSSGPSAGSTVTTNSVTFGLTPVVSPTAAAISTCETMLVAVTQAQFATVTSASTLALPMSSDSPPALTGAAQALGAGLGGSESPSALRKLLSADSPATTDSANPVVTAGSVLDSWLAATGSITYQGLADGYFVFKVYAIDIAGNIGPIAATPFRVDTGSGSDGSKKKRIIIGVVVGVGGGLLLTYAAVGWLLFGVGNILRFVSMRFAAQTVLSGLGSLQFVLIPLASRTLLGIRSHLTTVLGVGTVLLGNALIIFYGPPEVSFTLHQLRSQWATPAMQIFLGVLGGLLCSLQCVWWYITGQQMLQQRQQQHQWSSSLQISQHSQQEELFILSPNWAPSSPLAVRGPASGEHAAAGAWDKLAAGAAASFKDGSAGQQQGSGSQDLESSKVFMGALLFSAVASFIGAWSVLFSKSLTYIVTALPASLYDWYSWFVAVAFLGTAAFWVRQSDRGLRLYPASLIMPLMQAFWMCMSVVEGGIYFNELVMLPANSLLLLLLGLALALVGAVFMGVAGYRSEQQEAALAALAARSPPTGDIERMGLLDMKSGSLQELEKQPWLVGQGQPVPGSDSGRGLSTPVQRIVSVPAGGAAGGGGGSKVSLLATSGKALEAQQAQHGRSLLAAAEAGVQLSHLLEPSPPQQEFVLASGERDQLLPGPVRSRPPSPSYALRAGSRAASPTRRTLSSSSSSSSGGSRLAGFRDGPREYVMQQVGGVYQRVRQVFN
ncbi:hypothetical protein N2152v2_003003 [Parachlorella kessleri]